MTRHACGLDGIRMITACFARMHQRCADRVEISFLFMLQEVRPIGKTRNQLRFFSRSTGNGALSSMLLGYGVPTGSIIPRQLDGALALEPYAYDPAKARQLLATAGYANSFEAGDCALTVLRELRKKAPVLESGNP